MENFSRNCPKCGREIIYTCKGSKNAAERNNSKCQLCYSPRGKDHHAFGKVVPDEVREKHRQNAKKRPNPMQGRTPYDIWLEKYGKEEADKRQKEMKEKQLANTPKGENNPMFGKPSPQGSGNGWKGWFKDIYFRSLRELSFLIWLDEEKLEWSTGESKKIKIQYTDWNGQIRNYFPDFVVGNKMYEVKPQKLWGTPKVKLKKEAAEKYCSQNGLEYVLVDIPIAIEKIKANSENIKWAMGYKEKFENYKEK